jgi:hypothetical protein
MIQRIQVRQVKATMKGGHVGPLPHTREIVVEIVNVKVNDIELPRALGDVLQQQDVMGHGVDALLVQPKSPRTNGNEIGIGYRIPAGEESD